MKKVFALALALMMMAMFATTAMAGTAIMFPLRLMANPTTGYDWHFSMSEEGIISLTGGEFTLNDEDLMGAPGYYDYMIMGEQEGDTVLVMDYQQFDDAETSIVTVIYTIHVDEFMNVYVNEATISF